MRVRKQPTLTFMNLPITPYLLAVALAAAWQTFPPSSLAASPPPDDLALWLKADAGLVTQQPQTVSGWIDQAPGGAHGGTPVGAPILTEASFPNGSHPVIRFNGASGFNLDNDADLELPELSVFAVASVNNTVASEIFIGHFKPTFGWALGISDSTAGRVKWFTAPPQSMEPAAGSLGNNEPTLLTGTFGGGVKELFVNGALADSLAGVSLDYGGGGGALTVGYLGPIGQYLKGDIAELLVFNSADEVQRADVEAYLNAKYFLPDPLPDNAPPTDGMVLWLRADAGVNTQQPVPVYGWADQAPAGLHNGTSVGVPTLAQAEFPDGSHPVVQFAGGSGFNLEGAAGMELQDLSIYAVLSVDNTVAGQVFLGNYRDVAGWALGISDGTPGLVKWFTAPPDSLEPPAAALANHVPTLLTATRASDGTKTLYVNSTEAGTLSAPSAIPYGGEQLTLGYLQGNRQYMQGDLAEILVYSSVSESQRIEVETYLNEKYFSLPRPGLAISRVTLPGGAGMRLSWPQATGTGFTLQTSPQLSATTWTDLGEGTADGDQLVVEELLPASPGVKFYRLYKP